MAELAARQIAPGQSQAEKAADAAAKLAREAEMQRQARAVLAKERADGMRQGARNERERANAEHKAASEARDQAHQAELARRDALQEQKLAEQRVEIRGAAFWRGGVFIGLPAALLSAFGTFVLASMSMERGAVTAGAQTQNVLDRVAPASDAPLTVRDPAIDAEFALPDVVEEKLPPRRGREPAAAPR